jgi:hypothetical protein
MAKTRIRADNPLMLAPPNQKRLEVSTWLKICYHFYRVTSIQTYMHMLKFVDKSVEERIYSNPTVQ